jgi:hypothetical protein
MNEKQDSYTNAANDYYRDFENKVVEAIAKSNLSLSKQVKRMLDAKVRVEDFKKIFDIHNIRIQKLTGKMNSNHTETVSVYVGDKTHTFSITSIIGRVTYNR